MAGLTEEKLTELFDEKTYERGIDYYENGHVLKQARFKDYLYAKVIGNRSVPYDVQARVNGEKTFTSCTCPVGSMCKHGVALLLSWINEPDVFIDRNKIIHSLDKKSKAELLDIIKKVIAEHPDLIDELNLRKESRRDTSHINAERYINRVKDLISEYDFYDICIIEMLENIRITADDLRDDGRYMDASRIYLELVAAGLKISSNYMDDSLDREADHFITVTIKRFNDCAQHIRPESLKADLFDKISDIVLDDEFDLDTDTLYFGVVTKKNIDKFEKYLKSQISGATGDDSNSFSSEGVNYILSLLYEHLDMPEPKGHHFG